MQVPHSSSKFSYSKVWILPFFRVVGIKKNEFSFGSLLAYSYLCSVK